MLITDEQCDKLAFKISKLLNGISLEVALEIVERKVPLFLRSGHCVDTRNESFIEMKEINKMRHSAVMSSVGAYPKDDN